MTDQQQPKPKPTLAELAEEFSIKAPVEDDADNAGSGADRGPRKVSLSTAANALGHGGSSGL